MLFLADIKAAFINSSCSSVFSHCYIKHTEQASGVVQLMPEGPLRHLQLCLFNNAKIFPKVPSLTTDRMDRRSPVTPRTPNMTAVECENDTSRSKYPSLRHHIDIVTDAPNDPRRRLCSSFKLMAAFKQGGSHGASRPFTHTTHIHQRTTSSSTQILMPWASHTLRHTEFLHICQDD